MNCKVSSQCQCKVLFQSLPRGTEEGHGEPQSSCKDSNLGPHTYEAGAQTTTLQHSFLLKSVSRKVFNNFSFL